MKTKPLAGYRVLDLSSYAAASICAMTLADWGADVIKIEPLFGDPYRFFGLTMKCPVAEDDNIIFELNNRNKRGMSLDLKNAKGQEILHKLIETSDVLVTNYRPTALSNLKLTYEDLKDKYPRLIYAYLNGYGDKGPEKNKPGFDLAAYWARSGFLAELGEPDSEPVAPMAGFGDHPTGTFLAGGICAALLARAKTGRGCKVQTSLYSAGLWNLSLNIAAANNNEGGFEKQSRKKPRSALLNTYKTKDGYWITLAALEYDRYWKDFCEKVILAPELATDPRFCTFAASMNHSEELSAIIDEKFAHYTKDELVERLTDADIVHEVNLRFHEIKDDPQAIENGYIIKINMPSGRIEWTIGNPVQFDNEITDIKRYAPMLGEHNDEILMELGYSGDEIIELRKNGIIK